MIKDYWIECISLGADECDLKLTKDQLEIIAESARRGHEHYGMAFYSPPDSERLSDIEGEWKRKLKEKDLELQRYRENSEEAAKRALRLRRDDNISIEDHGEVFRYGGRIEQIQ